VAKRTWDIRPVEEGADLDAARDLFLEYARSLPFGLDFQDFDAELESLPGAYAAPRGRILLAWAGSVAAGCVALRPIDGGCCEMKRMYLRPQFRGTGLGRALAEAILAEARSIGYRTMRLDTVPGMDAALALYRSLGFAPIPPYRHNPIPGAIFLEAALGPGALSPPERSRPS
jgi:GNAT superfamily N-acetyltransferase